MIDVQPPELEPSHREPPLSRRRPVGRLVGGAFVVLVGIAWLMDLTTDISVTWALLVPLALTLVGLAVTLGARTENVSGLIGLGVVLTILTLITSAFGSAQPWDGVGQNVVRPQLLGDVATSYDHGIGDYTLDLSDVIFVSDRTIDVSLGIGATRIVVPDNVTVIVHAENGIGQLSVFGERVDGVGLSMDRTWEGGTPTIEITVDQGIGDLEIRR